MDMYVVEGGQPLRGTVFVSGSKNACLPLMCAALLADGQTVLENVPDLRDIRSMISLLEHLNAKVVFKNSRLVIDSRQFDTDWVPYEMMRKMRASMYAFGPTIARLQRAAVSKPGGCNIGNRPIDLHLKGFRALGVEMVERKGYVHARHNGLKGAEMSLLGPNGSSVGATCNVLMAAVLAEGRTVINGAAREPEVVELANFLTAMGAQIDGVGTETLTIDGVEHLEPVKWRVMPDRIEAATFAAAALMTDGDVLLQNINGTDMTSTLWALRNWGAEITHTSETSMRVRRTEGEPGNPLHLVTEPYPGLPTDVQPALVALLGLTPGSSTVRETIYFDRFMHVEELNRLGGSMRREGSMVAIEGAKQYEGAAVMASDLRAGAALVLAALSAKGESQVRRIYHVERGYERFEQKLASLGAKIRRAEEQERDPGLDIWEENETEAGLSEVETQA
ncbi:UDP-N-acetylglucosamine 1-carboxyvinyltransferase [bacterium]|nr:UDP-N-acetylglucosamine 1-carboxyvinyltransferase [bacterium]